MPPPPPPPSRRNDSKASAASKEENIYIPSFISKRPFYAGEETEGTTDYLEHQRLQKSQDSQSKWYDRGKKAGPAATKFRKGACENCGAMTHKAKDCLSRPRAKGARWTGKDIQADELIQDVQLGWDAKRDRWNGYDPKEYKNVVNRYNQMEDLRSQLQGGPGSKEEDEGDEEKDTGEKYAEESDMGRHQSTATRQLRLREDTAKYLLNLDLESAKYDPKTRTMVDAGATHDKAAQLFAEEGFLKASGEAADFEQAQKYAWEKQEKSGDTSQHLQANPTAGEVLRKKEKDEAEKKRLDRLKSLQDKYGGSEHTMPDALRDVAVTESETFVEYDESGLIKGAPRLKAKCKYAEDVFVNNHKSVWGSWWSNFKWGYACCHSFMKNSYCTGEEGKQAWEDAERQRTGIALLDDKPHEEEADSAAPPVQEDEPPKQATKKRTAADMVDGVTEEEMDEYRRKRTAADDPMANMLGKDELVN